MFEDEAVSPTSMATQLSMPLTTVADAIRTMERRGHARRIPNPRDGRSYLIVLHADAHDRFDLAYQSFLAQLPAGGSDARRQVARLLQAAERAIVIGASTDTRLEG